MQTAVVGFFDHNERWLGAVLEQGRDEGSLAFAGPAPDTARMIVSGLEGAMLVTRPYGGGAARFQVAAAMGDDEDLLYWAADLERLLRE